MSNTKLNEIQVAAKQVKSHLGNIGNPLILAVAQHLVEKGISYTEWEQSLSREEDLLQIRLIGREKGRKLWGIINTKRNSMRVTVQMPIDMYWIVNLYAKDSNATISDAVVSLLEIAIKERRLKAPDRSPDSTTATDDIMKAMATCNENLFEVEHRYIRAVAEHLVEQQISYQEWGSKIKHEDDLLAVKGVGKKGAKQLWAELNAIPPHQ